MRKNHFLKTFVPCFFIILLGFCPQIFADAVTPANRILGKWISKEKNLIVEVYLVNNTYSAKISWFSDHDDLSKPMLSRLDSHNPNLALRKRKLIGIDVLSGLNYNAITGSWENGIIYDANSGKQWNSCINMNKDGALNVKGYWHFKCFSKTIEFLPYK